MNQRHTVVQLLPALQAGGVERSTIEIAQALVQAGHRAIVVSAGGRLLPQLQAVGAEHVTLDIGRKSLRVLRHVKTLRQLFADEDVDIVHARSRLPAWLARFALRGMASGTQPKFVTTMHGLNSPSRYSAVMVSGERVVCVSDTVRDYALHHYPGTDPDKLVVIPRGIDPSVFPRAPRPDHEARRRVTALHPQLDGDGPLLLLPGRGTRLKGHADALRLLAALRQDGSDARLWLPGARQPGREAYLKELEAEASQLGVADVLAVTAPTSDIAQAYAASDLVLQLSRKPEAFGRTVLEALSVGRPLLGWNHGGVGELLRQWQPSGAVKPFDAAALTTGARSLLARPPPPPVTMPDSLHAMQHATLALYGKLVDDRAPRNTKTATEAPPGWRWAPAWILVFVALWPAPGYAEGVMVLGALAAVVMLLVARFRGGTQLLSGPAWALTSVLFAAYWVPELLSSLDAIDHLRALREVAIDLRYLPFLWLVASAVATSHGRQVTFGGLGVIMGIWTLDALAQAVFGTSALFWGIDQVKQLISGHGMCLASEAAQVDRLSGVLGPCNLKLGLVLASLSPFVLHLAGNILSKTRFRNIGWVLAAVAMGTVVLMGGSRASWLTFSLVLLFSGWRVLGWKKLAALFLFGALALAALTSTVPQVRERIVRTTYALTASDQGMDVALSGRTRIWRGALCMVRNHPVNGVGVRGFRDAFPACDPDRGEVAAWGDGPALHAHQVVLEVLSETGILGLLCWLAGAAMAWRAWYFADDVARDRARPAMLALAVTVFPFNTHLAFYSTFWGGLALLLAALYAGSLLARESEPGPGVRTT